MTQAETRQDSWQRSWAEAMPFASVGVLVVAVLAFHSLLQFNPGLEPLYILPIWLSIRLLGIRVSLLTIASVCFILTILHPQMTGMTLSAIFAGLCSRMVGFTLVGTLIGWFESNYSLARGLAYTDSLTGVMNRNGLAQWRNRLFNHAKEESVVVMLDCDGFKQINDRYGHTAGDHILRMLARILESETRSTDALVRMGGDEFALVLDSANAEEARIVLERVQFLFEQQVADAGYDCSISFGIAEHQADEGLDEVLAKADAAMYHHKKSKRQTYLA